MDNTIPTAEEFFRKFKHTHSPINHHLALIEFARLHVEAALEAASYNAVLASYDNKANKPGTSGFTTMTVNDVEWRPCSKSILNAYPLTLIK
jgi:hypothetical protein